MSARRGGADVRLLVPAEHSCDLPVVQAAGQCWYEWLLRRGVRIFEHRVGITHQKLLLADDRVLIGSANFDRWGLRWHLEADQAVHSRTFAERTAGMLERDFATARELDFEDWYQRSFVARLRERFWGRLEAVGARIAHRQRIAHVRREQTGGRCGRIDTNAP